MKVKTWAMFLKCIDKKRLFERVTNPEEGYRLLSFKDSLHLKVCSSCRQFESSLWQAWNDWLVPEPDVFPSLIKVYSRLQNDETLVLKGFKLKSPRHLTSQKLLFSLSRRTVTAGAVLGLVVFGVLMTSHRISSLVYPPFSETVAEKNFRGYPYARLQTSNVQQEKVQYLKPRFLKVVEFETAGRR